MYLWRDGGTVVQMAKTRTDEVTLKSQTNIGKLNDFSKGWTFQFRGFIPNSHLKICRLEFSKYAEQ